MNINYTAPASWTDFDMDWNNPDASKAVYIDAIRLATIERASALAHYGLNASIAETLSKIVPRPYNLMDAGDLITIHNAILTLIPYYLNPDEPVKEYDLDKKDEGRYFTRIDGEWTYVYFPVEYKVRHSEPQNLTHAKCLELIDAEEMEYPQKYAIGNNDWLKQAYQIINLLHTHHFEQFNTHGVSGKTRDYSDDDYGIANPGNHDDIEDSPMQNSWYSYFGRIVGNSCNPVAWSKMGLVGGGSTKFFIPALYVAPYERKLISYLCTSSTYNNASKWRFAPEAFDEIPYTGTWKKDIDVSIPANEQGEFILSLLEDVPLLPDTPDELIYKSADITCDNGTRNAEWEYGARFSVSSFIERFTFNFQTEAE